MVVLDVVGGVFGDDVADARLMGDPATGHAFQHRWLPQQGTPMLQLVYGEVRVHP
jgi:hypothetical protein